LGFRYFDSLPIFAEETAHHCSEIGDCHLGLFYFRVPVLLPFKADVALIILGAKRFDDSLKRNPASAREDRRPVLFAFRPRISQVNVRQIGCNGTRRFLHRFAGGEGVGCVPDNYYVRVIDQADRGGLYFSHS
jgi:hypothetical protein